MKDPFLLFNLSNIHCQQYLLDYPTCISDEISLSCKPGWHWYKGSCYMARNNAVPYKDAQADCSSQGGIVAPVRDFDEYFLIRRLFKDDLGQDEDFLGGQCMSNFQMKASLRNELAFRHR